LHQTFFLRVFPFRPPGSPPLRLFLLGAGRGLLARPLWLVFRPRVYSPLFPAGGLRGCLDPPPSSPPQHLFNLNFVNGVRFFFPFALLWGDLVASLSFSLLLLFLFLRLPVSQKPFPLQGALCSSVQFTFFLYCLRDCCIAWFLGPSSLVFLPRDAAATPTPFFRFFARTPSRFFSATSPAHGRNTPSLSLEFLGFRDHLYFFLAPPSLGHGFVCRPAVRSRSLPSTPFLSPPCSPLRRLFQPRESVFWSSASPLGRVFLPPPREET